MSETKCNLNFSLSRPKAISVDEVTRHPTVYMSKESVRKKKSLTLVGGVFLLQAQVLYHSPVNWRVLSRISAVRIALFWTEILDVVPGVCWIHSPSVRVTDLSLPC